MNYTTYDCKYHMVWITKYRKKVILGLLAERVRELIWGICLEHDVEILKVHVAKDHVHVFVSVPPYLAISKLKGKAIVSFRQKISNCRKRFRAVICGVEVILWPLWVTSAMK